MPSALSINCLNSQTVFFFSPSTVSKEIRGTVELSLSSERHIKSVSVALCCIEQLKAGNLEPQVSSQTLVLQDDVVLGRGTNTFEFVFSVSRHTFFNNSNTKQYITATVTHKEKLKVNLSCRKDIYFVAHPSDDGLVQYEKRITGHLDGIGPFTCVFRSDHLTRGGCIEINVNLVAPSPGLIIYKVTMVIEQELRIGDSDEMVDKQTVTSLLQESESPSKSLFKFDGQGVYGQWLSRLPCEPNLEPTHVPFSRNCGQYTHKLTLKMLYNVDGKRSQAANVVTSIAVPHCLLAFESVFLPQYKRVMRTSTASALHCCTCSKSFDDAKAIALGTDKESAKQYKEGFRAQSTSLNRIDSSSSNK